MPFDNEGFVSVLREKAGKYSQKHCAKYVRQALEAGGADTSGHPAEAKRYANVLLRNGFHPIAVSDPDKSGFWPGPA